MNWIKENNAFCLKQGEEILIRLHISKSGETNFNANNKEYVIIKKGFWRPSYEVLQGGKTLLSLVHRFWGSNGVITAENGSIVHTKYKTWPTLQLQFLHNEKEILSYATPVQQKKQVLSFSIQDSLLDAEYLLILSALGFAMINALYGENGFSSDDEFTSFLLMAAS